MQQLQPGGERLHDSPLGVLPHLELPAGGYEQDLPPTMRHRRSQPNSPTDTADLAIGLRRGLHNVHDTKIG